MTLADGIDLVDVLFLAVTLLVYSLTFCIFFAVAKLRERKLHALHRKRLDQLRGMPGDS